MGLGMVVNPISTTTNTTLLELNSNITPGQKGRPNIYRGWHRASQTAVDKNVSPAEQTWCPPDNISQLGLRSPHIKPAKEGFTKSRAHKLVETHVSTLS